MNYRVRHSTRYTYSEPVAIAHNEVRLTPRTGGAQQARRTQLAIDPPPSVLSQQSDFFGNTVHFFTLQAPHHEMTVTAVADQIAAGLSEFDVARAKQRAETMLGTS